MPCEFMALVNTQSLHPRSCSCPPLFLYKLYWGPSCPTETCGSPGCRAEQLSKAQTRRACCAQPENQICKSRQRMAEATQSEWSESGSEGTAPRTRWVMSCLGVLPATACPLPAHGGFSPPTL